MQRLKGRILLLGALAVLACSVDPTDNEGTPTAISANPEVVFVAQGDSQPIIASVVDEDGQVLQADISASNVGDGITVSEDATYLGTTTGTGINRQTRFFAKGIDLTASSFTLNGLGLTRQVQVTVVPGQLNAALSSTEPALGEAVTLTMPAGTFATAATTVSFEGEAARIESIADDGSSIVFVPSPNTDTIADTLPAVVSGVGVTSNPNLSFELTTSEGIIRPLVPEFPSTLSSATPDGGATVTLTSSDPNFVFDPTAVVLVGGSNTETVSVAGDGSSATFEPAPGATGEVSVSGVIVVGFPLTLPSTAGELTAGAAVAPTPGTSAPGTAPTVESPPAGGSRGIIDGNLYAYVGCGDIGIDCQIYKMVVPTDQILNVTTTWANEADLGLYVLADDGTTFTGILCDGHGRGGTAQPEACELTFPAGTYFLAVVPFGAFYPENDPNPDWVRINVAAPAAE